MRFEEDMNNIIRDLKFEIKCNKEYGQLEAAKEYEKELKKARKIKKDGDEEIQAEYIQSTGRMLIEDIYRQFYWRN